MDKEKEAVKHEDEMHAVIEKHGKELQEIGMYSTEPSVDCSELLLSL